MRCSYPASRRILHTPSNRVAALSDQSRFLTESEVAQLKDGRVLVIWRGSNMETTPGRKWYSVSTDGGMNLSTPAELKYDDGSSFYLPSSYHRMIRSSLNDPITTDSLQHIVTWNGNADVSRLRDQRVRVRFHIAGKAKLYAFQFVEE